MPGLMRAYPGITHENYRTLEWWQVVALVENLKREQG